MTRRRTRSPFKSPPAPRSPPPPVGRRPEIEQALCNAIKRKVQVRLKHDDDWQFRIVAPYVVYTTKHDKVMLASFQISNPEKPEDNGLPREFEIGKIEEVILTDVTFETDPRFDPFHEKYSFHVYCMVDRT